MTLQRIPIALAAALVIFSGDAPAAGDDAGRTAQPAIKITPATTQSDRTAAKRKARSKVKLVDINGADKSALKKLPGIDDAYADKIIASRPYGSKTWLVTNQILDRQTYAGIKGLIEARQPYKTAEENAALYRKQVVSK